MAIPTELQAKLKADGRDLLGRFRELAPPHHKVSIQRWSPRRIGLILVAILAVYIAINIMVNSLIAGLP